MPHSVRDYRSCHQQMVEITIIQGDHHMKIRSVRLAVTAALTTASVFAGAVVAAASPYTQGL